MQPELPVCHAGQYPVARAVDADCGDGGTERQRSRQGGQRRLPAQQDAVGADSDHRPAIGSNRDQTDIAAKAHDVRRPGREIVTADTAVRESRHDGTPVRGQRDGSSRRRPGRQRPAELAGAWIEAPQCPVSTGHYGDAARRRQGYGADGL
jgi:hypothetical protein